VRAAATIDVVHRRAIFGSVVIARVENGLDLLGLSCDFKSIATRLMLFRAASFDMRRRRGSLM
jgi:ABC-type xylose transport system permease subunit